MTDDTKPGTGVSNQWSARAERADYERIMRAAEAKGRSPRKQPENG